MSRKSSSTGKDNRPDSSVVQLHCNHFKNPQELSSVLKMIWSDERFSFQTRNDMYIIQISNSDPHNHQAEARDRTAHMTGTRRAMEYRNC
ncbi:hypothetical protein F4779DRAFT_604856 [Xylariaceae sp. FL0662B]|nr:hypothetical protein F4779DRAFT_604856 [Xylariaceae sp. FL0662B]